MSFPLELAPLAPLVQLLPDAAFIQDSEGRWRALNRPARLLLGLELGQVQGRSSLELAQRLPSRTDLFQLCAKQEQEAWLHRQAIRVEARLAVGTGERDLELTFIPLFGAHGRRDGIIGIARDQTQQVRTAAALRASERRYRDIFATNAVSIWEEDFSAARQEVERLRAQGVSDLRAYFHDHPEFLRHCTALVRVIDVNDTTLQLFGARHKEELLGPLSRLIAPNSLPCFGEQLIALMEGNDHYACETTNRNLRGEELHLLLRLTVPDYGNSDLVLVNLIDITDRKRAEEALRESREKLAEAQYIARMGNWERNLESGKTIWSDQVFRLFGFEPQSFEPSLDRLVELIHPLDRERLDRELEAAYGGDPYSVEYRILRQGEVAHLREYARIDRDRHGQPLRIIGTVQDVTDIRRSEALTERLGRILDRSPNEIFVTDAQTLRFIQVNRGGRRKLGYSLEQLLNMTPLDICPTLNNEQMEQQIRLCLEGAESITFEGEFERSDGSRYPMEARLHYSPEEQPPVFVAITQDISERKAVERMKAEFIASISHELRTPLTALVGALSLITGGLAGPHRDELIDIAMKNSERLLTLINDLLDLKTLESGKVEFRLHRHDLMTLVEQAVEMGRGLAAAFDVRIRVVHALPAAAVEVDGSRLVQVLGNLLANAAKFSPEGSEVEVSVERHGDRARVSVCDQGEGVPEEFRPRLFQRFAQADGSSTRRRGGTGLGLAISRAIVEAMGGAIGVEHPARGACFYFELPLLPE